MVSNLLSPLILLEKVETLNQLLQLLRLILNPKDHEDLQVKVKEADWAAREELPWVRGRFAVSAVYPQAELQAGYFHYDFILDASVGDSNALAAYSPTASDTRSSGCCLFESRNREGSLGGQGVDANS